MCQSTLRETTSANSPIISSCPQRAQSWYPCSILLRTTFSGGRARILNEWLRAWHPNSEAGPHASDFRKFCEQPLETRVLFPYEAVMLRKCAGQQPELALPLS